MEKVYKLKEKKLIKTGYPYLDFIKEKKDKKDNKEIKNILIAPTWINEANNLFEDFSDEIIEKLLSNNYKVTIRPHPEHFKISKKRIKDLSEKFNLSKNFLIERNIISLKSLILFFEILKCSG